MGIGYQFFFTSAVKELPHLTEINDPFVSGRLLGTYSEEREMTAKAYELLGKKPIEKYGEIFYFADRSSF